jgi:Ni,Fe-hydrogenase III component G
MILGLPWLNEHNPDINRKTGKFTWRNRRLLKIKRYHNTLHPLTRARILARQMIKAAITEETDEEERLNHTQNRSPNGTLLAHIEETWINARTTTSIKLHLKHDEKKADIPVSEQVPKQNHEYLDVFDEVKAD